MDPADPLTLARIVLRAAANAACLLAAGLALFHALHRMAGLPGRAARRMAVAASLAAVLLLGGVLFGEAAFLAGGDWTAALDPMLIGVILQTPIGDAAGLRLAGLAAVALLAFGPAMRWPAAGGALAVAASFALVGHSLGEPRTVLAALVCLHVAAVAYWIGAFAPLARAAASAPPATAGRLAAAFGRNAAVTVPVLGLAGGVLLVLLAGNPLSLPDSGWGRLMALKLAAVVLLLAFAAWNRLRLSPALIAGNATAAQALRRSILAEAVLALLILLATAAMTTLGLPA
jgi:copper resistance protein D